MIVQTCSKSVLSQWRIMPGCFLAQYCWIRMFRRWMLRQVLESSLFLRVWLFIQKDCLDRCVEEAGQAEGQRQAGVEFAGFDGVDALAGDFESFGQVGLAPLPLGAEDAKSVLHWFLHSLASRVIEAVRA